MISRSIYNLNIDTICMYDIPFDRSFLQLSNGIRHVMPSTDRKLELTAKASMVQPVSQPAVYCNGLSNAALRWLDRSSEVRLWKWQKDDNDTSAVDTHDVDDSRLLDYTCKVQRQCYLFATFRKNTKPAPWKVGECFLLCCSTGDLILSLIYKCRAFNSKCHYSVIWSCCLLCS